MRRSATLCGGYKRRTGIGVAAAEALLDLLDEAPLSVSPIRPYLRCALSIAATLQHPIYDCVYLARRALAWSL